MFCLLLVATLFIGIVAAFVIVVDMFNKLFEPTKTWIGEPDVYVLSDDEQDLAASTEVSYIQVAHADINSLHEMPFFREEEILPLSLEYGDKITDIVDGLIEMPFFQEEEIPALKDYVGVVVEVQQPTIPHHGIKGKSRAKRFGRFIRKRLFSCITVKRD